MGREAESSRLIDVVRGARRGGGVALVLGEAGIGKTRLVEACVAEARALDLVVLAGGAHELEQRRPFGAVIELVRAGTSAAQRTALEQALAAEPSATELAADREARVTELVVELVDELSTRAPVLVAVEDLHWADPATLALVGRLAREIEVMPVALVCTARLAPRRAELDQLAGELTRRGAVVVEPGPLDDDAVRDLVAILAEGPPGAELLRQAAAASGSPLFLEELVAALRTDGALTRAPDGTVDVEAAEHRVSLPITILHRLSFLPEESLDVLGLASVLGDELDVSELALLARRPVTELTPALREAVRAGALVDAGERMAFRHAVVRDALYADLPEAVRTGLHRELAGALRDAGAPVERVAEHVLRGARAGDPAACAWLLDAAAELGPRAPAAAVDLYERAIELSDDPDALRERLRGDLALAALAAGRNQEAVTGLRAALADPRAGALRLPLIQALSQRAESHEALREAEAAAADPALSPGERLQAHGWVVLEGVLCGQGDGAERAAEALRREALEADDGIALQVALNALALAANMHGDFALCARAGDEAVRYVEQPGERQLLRTLPHTIHGLALARLDRFDEARETLRRGRRMAESRGLVDGLPVFHYCSAIVDHATGRLDDTLAELDAMAALAEQTQTGWTLPQNSLRAIVALERDDLMEAEALTSAAERELAAGAAQFGVELLVLARARLVEVTGDPAGALAILAEAWLGMAVAGAAVAYPVIGPDLARLAALTGERQPGEMALGELERLGPAAPGLAAAAHAARGALERDGEALAWAARSLAAAGRPLESANAALRAAELAGGDDAKRLLEGAVAAFEASRANRGLAQADAALRELGVRRGRRGRTAPPKTGWEALTETELRVVRLVTERLTNVEIGERMFISRRTVQSHVSHALAKLGVSSRRELAAVAAEQAGWRIRVEDDDSA